MAILAVPKDYSPPSGIEYEVLADMYIPPDDNLLLESMAESLAGGATYEDTVRLDYRYIDRTDTIVATLVVPNRLPVPCEIDPCSGLCGLPGPDNPCGGGPGTPTVPGPPPNDPHIPRGTINVEDQKTCNTPGNPLENVAVRQARVVCKRWFKIWRGYTDDNGEFICGRKFKNKVKINVKTENDLARISKVRGVMLWQMLIPLTKELGKFNQGEMANVNYTFVKPNPTNGQSSELPYWVGATVHNSVIEQKEYALQDGIATPPEHLHILITNWNTDLRGSAATPLWNKCYVLSAELSTLQAFMQYFIAQPSYLSAPFGALVDVLKNQTDMIISYLASGGDYNCRLTSAAIKANTYHELCHASHYSQVGCNYWFTYRARIAHEISELATPGRNPPYGNGTEADAGVVGVGEMWGYCMEHIYTDRHYGDGGASGGFPTGFTAPFQGIYWQNEGGLNAYLNAIENFDPNLSSDEDRWIPKGLPYDLMDDRNDNLPVIDEVNGYTIHQCFQALQSDVRTIPAFKDRLLQQNANNQLGNVTDLFFRYGY